jgi:hypothetical protein
MNHHPNEHPIESRGSDLGRNQSPVAGPTFIGRAHADRNAIRAREIDGPTAVLPTPVASGLNRGGYVSKLATPSAERDINRHPFAQAAAWVVQRTRTSWVMPS